MPKRRNVVADFEKAAASIVAGVPTRRRSSTTTTMKGNALQRGGRSPASGQGQPRAAIIDPRVNPAYANVPPSPTNPQADAFGPPPEAFKGDIPVPAGAIAQSDTALSSIAPQPIVDKFPIVIGAGVSFAYLSAVQRTALTGYRMQYVDLAREIFERDPHLYAVVWKVVRGIANGRLEVTPATLPEGHKDTERAKQIANDIRWRLTLIRSFKGSLAALGWGAYYGVGACELHYLHDEERGWFVDRLGFIHSRRLSYPDMGSWDLYVWDQGQVLSASPYGTSPTNAGIYGLRVGDYPQKFMVFAPQIRRLPDPRRSRAPRP